MTKKQDYIKKVKEEIHEWENKEPGYITNILNSILNPAIEMAEPLIPEAVKKAVSKSVEGILRSSLFGAGFLFADKAVIDKVAEKNKELNSLKKIFNSDDLESMDAAADYYWTQNVVAAAVEGGANGAMPLIGLAANIPALLTIAFRCIQQIALCYGFDTSKDDEKMFMLGILNIASSSDIAGKQAAIVFMRQIQVDIAKKGWKKLAEEGGRGAIISLIRKLAKTIGINLTKRKALMLVPIIGAMVGASFDGTYILDVGRAAKNCYRKRKLEILGYYPAEK